MLSCWHYSLLLIALTVVQLILEESIYCLLIVIQHDQTGLKFRHVLTSKNETWKIDSGKVNPENKHTNYLLLSSNCQRQIFWTILQINNVIGKITNILSTLKTISLISIRWRVCYLEFSSAVNDSSISTITKQATM